MQLHTVHVDSRLLVSFARHSRKYQAIDIQCRRRGAPVVAVADGVVDYVGGYMLRIRHRTAAGLRRSVYTHIDIASGMRKGRRIEAGTRVGRCAVKGIKEARKRLFPKGVLHFEWQRHVSGKRYRRIDPLNGRRKDRAVSVLGP